MAGHGSKIKTNCFDQVSLPCGGILGDFSADLIGWQHGHNWGNDVCFPLLFFCGLSSLNLDEHPEVQSGTHLVLRTSSDGNHHQKKERIWRIHILDETNQRGESHCLNLRLVSGSLVAGKQPIVYEHKPQDFEHNWPQPPSLWWWVDPPLIIQTQQQSHSQNLHRLTCQVHCFGFFLVDGWHDVDGPNLKIHVKTVCSQLFSRSVFQFFSTLAGSISPTLCGLCHTKKRRHSQGAQGWIQKHQWATPTIGLKC